MITLSYILSGLSLLLSIFIFLKLKSPFGWRLIVPKTIILAASPFLAVIGLIGAALGVVFQAIWAVPLGIIGAVLMTWYVWGCTRSHKGFEEVFCADWRSQIQPDYVRFMLKRRWSIFVNLKISPEPSWERDVPFWAVPGTDRQLPVMSGVPLMGSLPAWHTSTIMAAVGVHWIKIISQDRSFVTWSHRDIR